MAELTFTTARHASSNIVVGHLRLHDLPSMEEITVLSNTLRERLAKERVLLHAEHVSDHAIAFPSVEHFRVVASILSENKQLIAQKLHGTVIQTKELTDLLRITRDAFLLLYRPQRPLFIVETAADAQHHLDILSTEDL